MKKLILILAFSVPLISVAATNEDNYKKEAEEARTTFVNCAANAIFELDDHVSDAETIGKAMRELCYKSYEDTISKQCLARTGDKKFCTSEEYIKERFYSEDDLYSQFVINVLKIRKFEHAAKGGSRK